MCCRLLCVLLSLSLLLFSSVSALAAEVYTFSEPVAAVPGEDFDADSLYAVVGVDPSDEEAVDRFLTFLNQLQVDSMDDFSYYYLALGYQESGLELAWFAYQALRDEFDTSLMDKTPIYSGGNLVGYQYTGANIGLQVGISGSPVLLGRLEQMSGGNLSFYTVANLTDMQAQIDALPTQADFDQVITLLQSIRTILGSEGLGTTVLSEIVALYSLMSTNFTQSVPIVGNMFIPGEGIHNWSSDSVSNNFAMFLSQLFGTLMYSNSNNTMRIYDIFTQMPYSFQWVGLDDVNHVSNPTVITGNGLFDYLGKMMFYSTVSSSYNLLRVSQNVRQVVNGDTSHTLTTYDYDEEGKLQETQHDANNLVETMVAAFEAIGLDLAKLQFVLADDASIEIKAQEIPNQDAFKDNFLGGGSGAAGVQDIQDAATISSSAAGLFQSDVSVSDFYGAFGDDSLFSFFTQETANNLDAVGAPAPASGDDDLLSVLDQFDFDENGVAVPKDPAAFDLGAYLAGKGG